MRCIVIYIGILSQIFLCTAWTSYEEYFILPENSIYCKDYQSFRRFSLSRQMSFTTGIYNASWNHLFYVCKVRIHPNGRLLHYSYPQGHTSYWYHRLRVDIRFASCGDVLTVGFIPEETTQQLLQPEELQLTCHEAFPKIFDSKHRIISLSWHTETGSTDLITSELDVQMSAYMRFEGNFGLVDKIQRCEAGSGFWCGNDTAVCIYGQMRCDQADGCFDGGSDEVGCPPPRNYTAPPPVRKPWGTWTTYLPWTAICLIPLILIFVLGLICTPRKSLEDLGDEETNQLKVNSPLSRTPSSASASSCDSPRSTHSAIAIPHRVTNDIIPRASSNPDLPVADRIHTVVVSEPVSLDCQRQISALHYFNYSQGVGQISVPPILSTSSQGQPLGSPRDVRIVNFKLPEETTAETHGRTQGSSTGIKAHIKLESGVKVEKIFGAENKAFALPAHFEMAAVRIRDKTEQAFQKQQNIRSAKCSEGADAWPLLNFHTRNPPKTQAVISPSKLTDPLKHTAHSLPDDNSSSTESPLEDVAPFRKPDHRTFLQPNGQPNGGLFSSITPVMQNGPDRGQQTGQQKLHAPTKVAFLKHPLDSASESCDRSSDYLLL
ncbi:hypothetical protein CRM22_011354 [Opisthorchis felineus]|uniref:CUB domain-containing protein n=1 Tax=Opisthorchis felineus TaxID=147828 RepID=A0A4V3S7F8_OPIFE|nr:hypothetical protein CRM22_011354 [Opisthorchis felineus]